MSMRFYNTLTKQKEEFRPIQAPKVAMYSCGPTVYQTPSIGNYRAFLLSDLLRRYLEWRGYQVTQVMNITDVGHVQLDSDLGTDKLEEQARKEGKDPWAIAKHYESIFFQDLKTLNCKTTGTQYPRATEHIPEMLNMIQKLLQNGLAYAVNGNVYFDITRFPQYGRLSNNTLEQLVAGARVEPHLDKKHPADFALWKQDPKHIMQWDSPWGKGFPGWHIECSAMATKYLGNQFDIHTGGEDLVFPHHECEIAQSQGASGKKPVNYWLHNSFLLVNGGKMSKSLGNVIYVQHAIEKGYSGRQLRFALTRVHYRMPLNFTWEGMQDAAAALQRLDEFILYLTREATAEAAADNSVELDKILQQSKEDFTASLDDDLNISSALATVFDMISAVYKLNPKGAQAQTILRACKSFDEVLGICDFSQQQVDGYLQGLLQQRQEFRSAKNWQAADRIRDELASQGYEIIDTPQGPYLKKK